MANSPRVREAEAQAVAARARALQASLYPNPTIGQASPQLAGNQTQYNAYVIQPLVTMGKIKLDAGTAQRAAREADLALVRARFDVLTAVRQQFYSALVAQRRAEIWQEMVKIAGTAKTIGERLVDAELAPRGDVLLLQIELARAEAELTNANTLVETTRRQLAAATGVIDLPIERVQGDLTRSLPEYELIALQRGVITRNALARSAEIEIAPLPTCLAAGGGRAVPELEHDGGLPEPARRGPCTREPGHLLGGNGRAAVQPQSGQHPRRRVERGGRGGSIQPGASRAGRGDRQRAGTLPGRPATGGAVRKADSPRAVELQRISAQLYEQEQIDFLRYLASQRTLLDANLSYIGAQEARWLSAAEVAGLLQSEQFP